MQFVFIDFGSVKLCVIQHNFCKLVSTVWFRGQL